MLVLQVKQSVKRTIQNDIVFVIIQLEISWQWLKNTIYDVYYDL